MRRRAPNVQIRVVFLVTALLLTLRFINATVPNLAAITLKRVLLATQKGASPSVPSETLQYLARHASTSEDQQLLARTALATGDYQLAARLWALTAVSPDQLPLAVVKHAIQGEGSATTAWKDTVAHYYLQDAVADLHNNNHLRAGAFLQAVLLLRNDDLAAHYYLLHLGTQAKDGMTPEQHIDALTHFDETAIVPSVAVLASDVAQIVPNLLDEKIWTYSQAQRAVAVLVLKFSTLDTTKQLLEKLTAQYGTDAYWQFYLGELYQRRGDYGSAQGAYNHVLDIDRSYAAAYVRLGMVVAAAADLQQNVQSRTSLLQQAARWYTDYNRLMPGDIFCMQRLAVVERQLDASQASTAPLVPTDTQVVANLLKVAPDKLQLGDNVLRTGDFEPWPTRDTLANWSWYDRSSAPEYPRYRTRRD